MIIPRLTPGLFFFEQIFVYPSFFKIIGIDLWGKRKLSSYTIQSFFFPTAIIFLVASWLIEWYLFSKG